MTQYLHNKNGLFDSADFNHPGFSNLKSLTEMKPLTYDAAFEEYREKDLVVCKASQVGMTTLLTTRYLYYFNAAEFWQKNRKPRGQRKFT